MVTLSSNDLHYPQLFKRVVLTLFLLPFRSPHPCHPNTLLWVWYHAELFPSGINASSQLFLKAKNTYLPILLTLELFLNLKLKFGAYCLKFMVLCSLKAVFFLDSLFTRALWDTVLVSFPCPRCSSHPLAERAFFRLWRPPVGIILGEKIPAA